jgi:hypothetical protein
MPCFSARTPGLCLIGFCLAAGLLAQDTPPATQQPATQQQTTPAPASTSKKPNIPDYPDPRTITFGVWGWGTIPGMGPDTIGGKAATGYETLTHFGKDHITPGVEASVPITRTGEIKVEAFLSKGDGSQNAPADTFVYGAPYNKGDFLSTQYQITSAKVYLDDLLYPFKFPVAKFRVKSLWEAQWVAVNSTVDAPLKAQTVDSSGNLIPTSSTGTRTILLPTFGLAAEYAISPHVLLRADGSGFGLPHRAELWDVEGYVSYRRKLLEIRGGFKILHFKSSPTTDEYVEGTIQGGFVSLLYHWQ